MTNYIPPVIIPDQKIRIHNSKRHLSLYVKDVSICSVLTLLDNIEIKPSKKGEIWVADSEAYSNLKSNCFIKTKVVEPGVINLWPLADKIELAHFIWLSISGGFFDSYSLQQIITLAGSHFHIGLVTTDSLYFTTVEKLF